MSSAPPPPPHVEAARTRTEEADIRAQAEALAAQLTPYQADALAARLTTAMAGMGQLGVTDQWAQALAISAQDQNQQGLEDHPAAPQPLPAAAQRAQAQAHRAEAVQVQHAQQDQQAAAEAQHAEQAQLEAQRIQAALGQLLVHHARVVQQQPSPVHTIALPGYPQIQQAPAAIMGAIVPAVPAAAIAGNLVGVVPAVTINYSDNPAAAAAAAQPQEPFMAGVAPPQHRLIPGPTFASAVSTIQEASETQAAATAPANHLISALPAATLAAGRTTALPAARLRHSNTPLEARSTDLGAAPAASGRTSAITPSFSPTQAIEGRRDRDEERSCDDEGTMQVEEDSEDTLEGEEKKTTPRVLQRDYGDNEEELHGGRRSSNQPSRSLTDHAPAAAPAASSTRSSPEAITTELRNTNNDQDEENGGPVNRKHQRDEPEHQEEGLHLSLSPRLRALRGQEGQQTGQSHSSSPAARGQQSGSLPSPLRGPPVVDNEQQDHHIDNAMSQSERKIHRERQRRSELNRGFQSLMAVLARIDRIFLPNGSGGLGTGVQGTSATQHSPFVPSVVQGPGSGRGALRLMHQYHQPQATRIQQQLNRVEIVHYTVEILESLLVRGARQVEREMSLVAMLEQSERERLALVRRLREVEGGNGGKKAADGSTSKPRTDNPNATGDCSAQDPKDDQSSNSKSME